MFDKRSDLVRFLSVAKAGGIGMAADRLAMTQPALTRVIARLERELGGRLFECTPAGVRLTAFGAALTEPARRVLREIDAGEERAEAARSGRTGLFRVTAAPLWGETVLAQAATRFQEVFPAIELRLATATRAEGLRLLADGRSNLHCGGIDDGRRLPDFLRRERFVDLTAGIVARRDHPLFARDVTGDDLARCPWIDVDASTAPAPGDPRPSLGALLDRLHETTHTRVTTIVRSGPAALFLMATGPYLAWLSLDFLERLPGLVLRPLRSRSGATATARASSPGVPPRTCRRSAASRRSCAKPRSGRWCKSSRRRARLRCSRYHFLLTPCRSGAPASVPATGQRRPWTP